MKASALELRLRYLILGVLYGLGLTAPWNTALHLDSIRTWQFLAAWCARSGWIGFSAATISVLFLGIVLALAAALIRTWGAAYATPFLVKSPTMQDDRIAAAGPYRFLRHPLTLGLFLHTFALALLMPPSGAVFCIVAVGLFALRLIRAEESFLAVKLGAPYSACQAGLPRILPSLTPRLPSAEARPKWTVASLGELYFWGVFLSFAALGWRYNAFLILQGVLVSLGAAIIVRAFLPKAVDPPPGVNETTQ